MAASSIGKKLPIARLWKTATFYYRYRRASVIQTLNNNSILADTVGSRASRDSQKWGSLLELNKRRHREDVTYVKTKMF